MDRKEWDEGEVVSIAGRFMRFGELVPYLRADLLYEVLEFAGVGATMQAIVDAYVELAGRRARTADVAA